MQLVINGSLPVHSYKAAYSYARRRGLPTGFWRGKCNTFRTSIGPYYGRGWVLMLRRDAERIANRNFLEMMWRDGRGNQATLKKLVFINASLVFPAGRVTQREDLMMVEIADIRYAAQNPAWGNPINKTYNVRAPAAAQTYYADSLNAGAAWTWQTMLDNIWGNLQGATMGAAPQLPVGAALASNPEGFRFHGVSAWWAWTEALAALGCAPAVDPFTGDVRIIRVGYQEGGDFANFNASLLRFANRCFWWTDVIEANWAKIPEKVRVFFHKQAEHYGTEKTTNWTAGNQWAMDAVHSVDVTAADVSAAGAIPGLSITNLDVGSFAPLWDDLPALVDFNAALTNGAACTARALERAKDYYRSLFAGKDILNRIYSGPLQDNDLARPGPALTGVAWLEQGQGMITEILRMPSHMRPFSLALNDLEPWLNWKASPKRGIGIGAFERVNPPDFGRQTHPIYPPPLQIVRVTSSTAVAANTYAAEVLRIRSDAVGAPTISAAETCYVWSPAGEPYVSGDIVQGRLNGAFDANGAIAIRPLYLGESVAGSGTAVIRTDTDTPDANNRYDSRIQDYAGNGTWSNSTQVWLVDGNNAGKLVIGERYLAKFIDFENGRPVYATCDFNLTIQDENGGQAQSRTLIQEFGPAAKVTITNIAARVNRVYLAGLEITDLTTGITYSDVQYLWFDSTPSAYDPLQGDYVFQWFDEPNRILLVRLNGFTGNRDFLTRCVSGLLKKSNLVFSNGLAKMPDPWPEDDSGSP